VTEKPHRKGMVKMKNSKKIFLAGMAILLILSFAACNKAELSSTTIATDTTTGTEPAITEVITLNEGVVEETTTLSGSQATTITTAVSGMTTAVGATAKATTKGAVVTTKATTKVTTTTKPEPPVTLTISAATSLTNAMNEIATAYKSIKPNVTLQFNFGASGTLQTQIEQGAPADIFLSAAQKQMDALQNGGYLINSTRKNYWRNKLVLIVPSSSNITGISSFADVTKSQIRTLALGEASAVPAGQYAEEVFKYYNVYDQITGKIVRGANVGAVLTYVETGNADAGVVYETDAASTSKVKIVARAPEESHTPVLYPGAIIKSTKNLDAATAFMNFLVTSQAKNIFVRYGFTNVN